MDKNITIIGVGKLGLALALNLEKAGFNILGIDTNKEYIDSLSKRTFNSIEPYINEYLQKARNIEFTTDMSRLIENDIIFIVVQTPSTDQWKYDHTKINEIIELLLKFGFKNKRKDIIINSTTFPNYCKSLQEKVKEYNYYISYNPEFIAQGSIIKDQIYADSVLIGEADEFAGNLIEKIYKNICKSSPVIHKMNVTEAEITKLATNCFLTTKISFANMVGDIAIRNQCNPSKILDAIGSDSRIGNKYLKYGFGFGGPCFPRDNRALAKCAEEVNINAIISKATDEMNEAHLEYQIEDFVKNNKNKNIEILIDFVTYKKGTNIIEESQRLKFALKLAELGYKITITEIEEVINLLKNKYGDIFKYIKIK